MEGRTGPGGEEKMIPYPAVEHHSELPEDAPIGALAPVGKDTTNDDLWLKLEDGWFPATPIYVTDFADLPDDVPNGARAIHDLRYGVKNYYIKVDGGWAIDGDQEMENN